MIGEVARSCDWELRGDMSASQRPAHLHAGLRRGEVEAARLIGGVKCGTPHVNAGPLRMGSHASRSVGSGRLIEVTSGCPGL